MVSSIKPPEVHNNRFDGFVRPLGMHYTETAPKAPQRE